MGIRTTIDPNLRDGPVGELAPGWREPQKFDNALWYKSRHKGGKGLQGPGVALRFQ